MKISESAVKLVKTVMNTAMGHAKEIITIDVYGDNREIIEDCLENLEPFIDEVLPVEEVIDLCDVDCMDLVALELIE